MLTAIVFTTLMAYPQATLEWNYFMKSTLRDHDRTNSGKGDLQNLKARINFPLSMKLDSQGKPRMWNMTLSASHYWLGNEGLAHELNPTRVINASLNLSHIRNINEKWMLIASLGVGIYAPTDYVTFKSVLANGGAIFAYRLRPNLSLGIGAGLTNSYGVPMVVPMAYLDWRLRGRVEVTLNLSYGIKANVRIKATKRLAVDITPIEFDGMSAVVKHQGKDRIYSTLSIRSLLSAEMDMGKGLSLFGGAGGVLLRNISIQERKISNLFDSDDENKYRFNPAPQLTAGIRYKF